MLESLFELERAAGRLEDDAELLAPRRHQGGPPPAEDDPALEQRAAEVAGWTDRVQGLAAGLADACADAVEQLAEQALHGGSWDGVHGSDDARDQVDLATTLALTARRSSMVVERAARARAALGRRRHAWMAQEAPLDASGAARRALRALERITEVTRVQPGAGATT
jgi:hypothetical protein